MREKVRFTLLTMVLTLSIFGIVHTSNATSTYSNQYNTAYGTSVSCSFCHTTGSALNPTGTKFKNSGFNLSSIAPVPTVTAFSIPATSTSLTVTITTLTATDNVPITGYMVTESPTPPSASAAGWSAAPPTSYTFATVGTKTLYAWTEDAANVISPSISASTTITLPPVADTTPPTVTGVTLPSTSTTLNVPYTITATDNAGGTGVVGYLVKESPYPAPAASDPGWSASSSGNYPFATPGSRTLYAWAKDGAGNVSTALSATVIITAPDTTTPPDMTIWVGKWFKITTKITGSCSGSSGMLSDSGSFAGYLKLWEWDPNNKILQADLYEYGTATAQWSSQSLPLLFIAGNDLDFLFQSQVADNTANSSHGFTARIVGKETAGVLKSAAFKSLGGYYIDALDQSGTIVNCAGGLKLTGALISESKVPVPAEVTLH
jgi:hypothetical protein